MNENKVQKSQQITHEPIIEVESNSQLVKSSSNDNKINKIKEAICIEISCDNNIIKSHEKGKCKYRKCKNKYSNTLMKCEVIDCNNYIHPVCYNYFVKENDAPQLILHDNDSQENYAFTVCGKRCYNKQQHYIKQRHKDSQDISKYNNWSKDGPKDNPSNTSMKILLDWFLEEGGKNYKYRGKHTNGLTKDLMAEKLAKKMNAMGVRIERNGKMVQNKINHIGLRWKLADNFVNRTGQGLLENDQVQEFNDLVKNVFYITTLNYYLLCRIGLVSVHHIPLKP
jgi:hypothetical protein